jgi:hypothetical protein
MGFVNVTKREFPEICCSSYKVVDFLQNHEFVNGRDSVKAIECDVCQQVWVIQYDPRGEAFWSKK